MKRQSKLIVSIILCIALLTGMFSLSVFTASAANDPVQSRVTVQKITNMPDEFMNGVDLSSVLSLEESGVKFYDKMGNEGDLFQIMADSGVNYVRIRIWNDPWDAQGRGYGGGNCDVPRAAVMARRAADAGMKVLLNFHYSDFWADPGKQMVPKAWTGFTVDQKADAIYAFTKQSVQYIIDQGGDVGMVQIGNETNGSMCGVSASGASGQVNFSKLIQAGSRAVREIDPDILVAVHISDPQRGIAAYRSFNQMLVNNGVDYDVFGSSYYPFWHGTIASLTSILNQIRTEFGKKVAVFETSYMWTTQNGDGWNNTGAAVAPWTPATIQNQCNFMRDIIQGTVDAGGVGVFVWEPAWLPVGANNRTQNQPIWEKYGSGWAASYAAEYDPADAGQWYGGCDCEHRSFFDYKGRPLPSLDIFNLVRTGTTLVKLNSAPAITATAVQGDVKLPAMVNGIFDDGETRPVFATWNQTAMNNAINGAPGVYTIAGFAGRAYDRASGNPTDTIAAGVATTLTLRVVPKDVAAEAAADTGSTAVLPITFNGCVKISGARGEIEYDDALLTLQSITAKKGFSLVSEGNAFVAVTQNGAGLSGDVTVGYAVFSVKDGLLDDVTTNVRIPWETLSAYDETLAAIYPARTATTLTIVGISPLIGDVSLDGNVSVADAIQLMQYLAGSRELTARQLKAADANKDGNINVGDVSIIMQMCL